MAYSGFNREYYTNYYTPTVYYPTPYHSYSTYYTPSYSTYYTPSYSYPNYIYTTYSPTYTYGYYATPYYPTYSTTTFVRPTYIYPYTGRNISIYSGDSGWGISYSSGGGICNIYGYC